MGMIDYHRHTLQLEALPPAQRMLEIERFSHRVRVFHYTTDCEHLAPHGGGLSLKMVVRGSETFIIGRQRVRISSGEALLMTPSVEYASEITQTTESFSVFFPPRFCLQLGAAVRWPTDGGLERYPNEVLLPVTPQPIAADSALRIILRVAREHLEHGLHERAEELLQEAALRLRLTASELQQAEERLALMRPIQRRELLRRLHRARAHLHDNLDHQVDLDRLAEVSHVSRFHLLRSFRKAFGQTPAQYQAELRLQRAASLLEQNQQSIADVAQAVGYRSHSAFSRAWKRRFGSTPQSRR